MYVYIYAYIHTCIYIYIHTYTYVFPCEFSIRMQEVCVSVFVCVCVRESSWHVPVLHMYICMYMHPVGPGGLGLSVIKHLSHHWRASCVDSKPKKKFLQRDFSEVSCSSTKGTRPVWPDFPTNNRVHPHSSQRVHRPAH